MDERKHTSKHLKNAPQAEAPLRLGPLGPCSPAPLIPLRH